MIATLFGLILIATPFLLVFCFKNRFLGFASVLGSVITTHLIIAFVTQFFHIFLYPVILIIHSIIALGVLAVIKYKFPRTSFKFKINWLVLLGFLIIFFELWSVHFLYTGNINTIANSQKVFARSYPYPYFSDEWIGVSFSNYSISNNALPITNPLALDFQDNRFPNIFVCFFSLIAEIFLVLSINPLFGYTIFSLISGLLICLLTFIFLRTRGVDPFWSLFATLCVPFIVNGANLPGLWYFIPFTAGFIVFMLSLIMFGFYKNIFSLWFSVLAVILYPPLVVFVLPSLLIYLTTEKSLKNKTKWLLTSLALIGLSAVLIIYTQPLSIQTLWTIAKSSAWRLSLDNGIPAFYFWNIIPWPLLPFSIIGLASIFNKKNLTFLVSVIIGLILWVVYMFSSYYFFIDYARVVVLSSFLLVTLSGLGIDSLFKKYSNKINKQFVLLFKIFTMIIFLLWSLTYTNNLKWQDLTLMVNGGDGYSVTPAPPANQYLTDEDLNLFKGISKERFLSIPWKGLVIGVATGNYPLHTKQSIVSNNFLNYNAFMNKTCEAKTITANKIKLSYVYSTEFKCDNFKEIGSSSEGLYLYKFTQ